MAKLSIHHATAAKAAKAGIELRIDDETFIAIDTKYAPNNEYSGRNAAELLSSVLGKRKADNDDGEGDEDEGGGEDGVEEVDAEEEVSGSVVKPKYKQEYDLHDGTCGDQFADAFSVATRDDKGALDYESLRTVGDANGIDIDERWPSRNRGYQGRARMSLSNILRGMVRQGKEVVIGKTTFKPELDAEGKPIKGRVKVSTSRGALR